MVANSFLCGVIILQTDQGARDIKLCWVTIRDFYTPKDRNMYTYFHQTVCTQGFILQISASVKVVAHAQD